MSTDIKKIGIIGCGNMGLAIAIRLKSKFSIYVFDKDENKTKNLNGFEVEKNTKGLVSKIEAVILAVKPQDFDSALIEIKKYREGKLFISIAAGISCAHIEKILGKVRIIRAMPNLPAKIGQGITCLAKGNFASNSDLEFSKKVFNNLGETLVIKENLMNAATAVSGSGPGFLYAFLENKQKSEWEDFVNGSFVPELCNDAIKLGFKLEQAKLLSEVTAKGSLALLEQTGLTAQELLKQVTSKGGTTQAGLEKLDINNIASLEGTTGMAFIRAQELEKGQMKPKVMEQ